MEKIEYKIEPMVISKNIVPYILQEQYKFRQTGEFNHNSMVVLMELEEPIWWNRPEKAEVFTKQENDGLYSLNLPYFEPLSESNKFKLNYNLLLNVGSVPASMQLRIGKNFKAEDVEALKRLPIDAVYNTLIELGVDATCLTRVRNDLLYNGKKVMGMETIVNNGWISFDFVVTLFYKAEEEVFKRLSGKYALARGITGILDETDVFTKDDFINTLLINLRKYLSRYYVE